MLVKLAVSLSGTTLCLNLVSWACWIGNLTHSKPKSSLVGMVIF